MEVCRIAVNIRTVPHTGRGQPGAVAQTLAGRLSLIAVVVASLFTAACTIPYEQLSLPGPIVPPSGQEPQRPAATNKGLALAKIGDASASSAHIFPGTGNFTADGSAASGAPKNYRPASGGPTSTVTAEGVTINLSGATISEVSKTILGDLLGVNFSVSDKLKGSITLKTSHPIDKSGLLDVLQTVLRNEGATLVVKGDFYQVLPSAEAGANGVPLRRTDGGTTGGAGLSTEIVPLRFVSPAEMERVLHTAAPQAGIVRVDAARNIIMLSGSPSELASLRELVDVFDVDWMRGMSFGLFPIEAADPEAISKELDTIFANDRDSPTKGVVRFIPNRRLKSILVISTRAEYLHKAQVWIARIDKVNRETQKQVYVYHVQHRSVAELAKLLQKVYGGQGAGGFSGRSAGSGQSEGAQHTALAAASGSTSGLAPAPSSGANATGAAASPGTSATLGSGTATAPASPSPPAGDSGLAAADSGPTDSGTTSAPATDDRTSGISVVADEPNNSLVVTATAGEYGRVLRILETLDTHPNEVLLEATIAEVSLNDQLNFGVRWFFQNQANSNSVGFYNASGAVTGPLAGLSYFINATNVKVLLNALSTVTDVNVLSQPSLMVVENKKATLQVGDEVPILTQTQQSAAVTGTPTISNAVSYRNTGILLSMTPRVAKDGRVLIDIEQEVSDTKSNTTSGIDSPAFSQRRVKTTITVNSGETIVLAGMIQDKATRSRDQVPVLGTLPVIGNAFKNKTDSILRTELIIAITPQVIKDSRQIDAVTAEFRDSLNMSTRPQRRTQPDRLEDLDRILR